MGNLASLHTSTSYQKQQQQQQQQTPIKKFAKSFLRRQKTSPTISSPSISSIQFAPPQPRHPTITTTQAHISNLGHDNMISFTPTNEDQNAQFKRYCPLCMCYFRTILETTCCANYTCYSCALSYCKQQKACSKSSKGIPVSLPKQTPCPHCALPGCKFNVVESTEEKLRTYSDELTFTPSPVKARLVQVGDDFATQRSKMLRFTDYIPYGNDSDDSTCSICSLDSSEMLELSQKFVYSITTLAINNVST